MSKEDVKRLYESYGIEEQRLYKLGAQHANCSLFCCKAGQGQFKMMLDKMPKHFAFHEAEEQALRDYLGKPVSILKRKVNGKTVPYTLRELRERV